ncbi:hypothetical protein Calkr_1443 [Caldicellulosiruptor acetigenus I77R1B]|uniref:Phage holin family protein n=1 Tax=Caldicellulosiruptor acetigenus (strain ATCC 700853 / DSM 12137 / I77R1B) TaxID=632335 RepID=E4S8U8_CALA7|nr:phage holin family protein [Caldicellulosiruptor acetigenus]ADQ40945.1 hypothetical protein Calkr_1443 [Caldicellulosiruptor acetigenus I77R1B]
MSEKTEKRYASWLGIIVRFVVASFMMLLMQLIYPNFVFSNWMIGIALIVAISVITYIIERITTLYRTPIGRGIIAFLVTFAILYFANMSVPGIKVPIIANLITSFVVGMFDIFLPDRVF